MPFGGLLSIAGPLVSGGSALAGLFGGSPASQVQIPQGYQMGNMGGADQGAYGGIGSLGQYNVPGQLLPQYQQIAQSGVNNPYAGGYLSGANTAGQLGQQVGFGGIQEGFGGIQAGQQLTGAGQQLVGAGQQFGGAGMSALPDVQTLLSLGFDPQNALYAQQQNLNQQQNAAILGQSGVASTPYGAGVQQQANTNFNLGWENQQLGRAAQGAGAAGNLLGSIGGALSTGAGAQATGAGLQTAGGNLGFQGLTEQGTGVGQIAGGAGMPYNAYQGITSNQLGLLGQYGSFGQQAAQLPQQQIQDYLSYLAQGTSQQGANNQGAGLGLQQANQGFLQNQTLGGQLGQSLAGLSKGWGNTSFGGGNTGGNVAGWSPQSAGAQGSPFYGPIQ